MTKIPARDPVCGSYCWRQDKNGNWWCETCHVWFAPGTGQMPLGA